LDVNSIENRLVFGNFHGRENQVSHVWNEVKINGEWLPADTTGNGFGKDGNYKEYVSVYFKNQNCI